MNTYSLSKVSEVNNNSIRDLKISADSRVNNRELYIRIHVQSESKTQAGKQLYFIYLQVVDNYLKCYKFLDNENKTQTKMAVFQNKKKSENDSHYCESTTKVTGF